MTEPEKKPLEYYVEMDWSTMTCPCGKSLCSNNARPGEWDAFLVEHKPHTNGMFREVNDPSAAAKIYGSCPPPREAPIP